MKLLTKFAGLKLFLLLSFTSVFASSHPPTDRKDKVDKTPMSIIIKLVDEAYNDSISKLLFEYEVKRVQSEFDTSILERKARIEKFLELSKKEKLSDEDIKYAASELGFKNPEEYVKYLDLASKLIEKYGIMKLDKESQLAFCKLFYEKQIGEMKEKGSIVFVKFNKNMSSLSSSWTPECSKCCWDYQSCLLSPYVLGVNTVISDDTATTTGTRLNQEKLVTTATATYSGVVVYTTYVVSGCYPMYINCLQYCRDR